ncbi:MAG: hypothetical protein JXR91_05730 [Deltaproteobacteria bacterium]|nr:hypothetical protein [Deltaproteobacteria bacterium]
MFPGLSFSSEKNESSDGLSFFSSVGIGLGTVDEDLFFLLMLEQGISYNDFKLRLSGPFRFRIYDKSPDNDTGLRSEDWDDPSDWARILRSIDYNRKFTDGGIALHIGELNGVSMGHSTIVSSYFNSTDMDYYQGGATLGVDVKGNGIEFLMNNFVSPSIFSGRTFVAPFAWFVKSQIARRFRAGFDFMVDSGVRGTVFPGNKTSLFIAGGDLEFGFVKTKRADVAVRVDVNGVKGSGGVHAGIASSILLSPKKDAVLNIMGEYRYAGANYYPALLNPFYDYNRRYFTVDPVTDDKNTFVEHLDNPSVKKRSSHGFAADLALSIASIFKAGVHFDYQSNNRPIWIMFKLELSPVERFSLRAFLAGQDIYGKGDLFSSDSLIGTSLQIKIIGPLFAFAEYQRRYRAILSGNTSTANEISGGVSVSFSY